MSISTYVKLQLALQHFKRDQRGVTSIEYAIIGVAIAAIMLLVFSDTGPLATALNDAMNTISTQIQSAQ
ncbi:Flp family type IVb pilin [Vibrio albus]|uniref:Flp family type IVb pilin n=1 Tax=Vibrio albus TaxID=2200953 RepID=A0A2U3BEN7_9VIBR|nr:Flp family type IVb pilin [Vibrio albus]PWI35240.1 Flp family type IVb pilin [Vibrio albus]